MFYEIIFFVSAFIILWAMVGYPLSLKILKKFNRKTRIKNYDYKPTVTIMVVAYNEEKVILKKLKNIVSLDYPKDKINYLISSDNSTDNTNVIVEQFIKENPEIPLTLYKVKKRKGKTNAQNEAQKLVNSEILVMTDANAMLKGNSIIELVSTFTSNEISYVCGRLIYINEEENDVASSENSYWNLDLSMREIESDIQTITAGNGALYACRNSEYHNFDPIKSHDSNMPRYFALRGKRALFNSDAIAYEKAGENIEDEFKRKIRMNRGILRAIFPEIRVFNVFKYKWYSYFYFGHRTCRYLLWISHFVLFIANVLLIFEKNIYTTTLLLQIIFYFLGIVAFTTKSNNKFLLLIYYYLMTILAQWIGVYNVLTGKTKPFWDKAESTR